MDSAASPESLSVLHALSTDIRAAVGRIASHLESETRYRDSIGSKFQRLDDTIFGNGKPGVIRDLDKVKMEVGQVREDLHETRGDVKAILREIEDGKRWVIVTLLVIVGKIAWEFSSEVRRGAFRELIPASSSQRP